MRFCVKLEPIGNALLTRSVDADYFRIEAGALIFRNVAQDSNSHPQIVHVFAAGAWTEVQSEVTP